MPDKYDNIKGISVPRLPWHVECPNCAGSGRVPDPMSVGWQWAICPNCLGRGSVPRS